jgi:predicted nucleic acid-binding protein
MTHLLHTSVCVEYLRGGVTHNLAEFSRIPGLGLEDWTTT